MTAPGGKYVWTREVRLSRLADDLPVIAIRDSYSGEEAAGAKSFSLNLMSQGAVDTPAGPQDPVQRIWGYEGHHGDKRELPSSGKVFALERGVNRLRFTGQEWPAHATRGIDWDLDVIAPEEQQAHIGNWADAWCNSRGMSAFAATNGRPFEERQDILRIRAQSGFTVFIVPYGRGRRPEDLAVTVEAGRAAVTGGGKTVIFDLKP